MDFLQRWRSLLSAVATHESVQEANITRGYVSASLFAFGITSSDALEQLFQDILLSTEALEKALSITAANANISPHAASLRRAWHESWAICHERNTHQQCSMDLYVSDMIMQRVISRHFPMNSVPCFLVFSRPRLERQIVTFLPCWSRHVSLMISAESHVLLF